MTKKKSMSNIHDNSWNITRLLQSSYRRWKNRFISYFLANVLIGAIWIGVTMALIISGGMLSLIGFIFFKTQFVFLIILLLGSVFFVCMSVYLFALLILTNVKILTEESLGIVQTIRNAKTVTPGYVWVGITSAFFLIGFFPFGLITLFIIPLLWSFWSSFTTFVYVERQEKGLQNLWISRQIYNQKFRLLFVRSLIPFGLSLLISIPHIIAITSLYNQSVAYIIIYFLSFLLSFIYIPYAICYNYELYKKLPLPQSVKTPH